MFDVSTKLGFKFRSCIGDNLKFAVIRPKTRESIRRWIYLAIRHKGIHYCGAQ